MINKNDTVRLKTCGNVSEVRSLRVLPEPPILKLNRDEYVLLSTGEVKPFRETEKRIDNIDSVKRSMANLRDIINANITDPSHAKWVTLTYAENMQDSVRLYEDLKSFHKKLKKFLGPAKKYSYIIVAEPQGRGAWHAHMFLIFDGKAPFIPNHDIAQIWGHGFTKTKALDNKIANIGLYFSAYLSNIPGADGSSKKYQKGERLKFYPKGFRFYRTSRNIKKPELIDGITYAEALETLKDSLKVYEKDVAVVKNNRFINFIKYEQFIKKDCLPLEKLK